LQRDAVIQGFRRGRAPRRLIEKRFGANIRDTVKQQVVAEAYQKAIADNKLEALGDPDADLSKIEMKDGENLVVTVEVEVAPEFELPSIEKIAVKRPKLEATEERLNLAVENLRKYFGTGMMRRRGDRKGYRDGGRESHGDRGRRDCGRAGGGGIPVVLESGANIAGSSLRA